MKIELRLGQLSDSIESQLEQQGILIQPSKHRSKLNQLEKFRSAANMLYINGLMTEREIDSVRRRILQRVIALSKGIK
jgi:hypothetical protein